MIKNFENFVNEGFWDNIGAAVDAGMQGYKINKSVEKAADEEQEKLISGRLRTKISKKLQMTRVIELLFNRVSWMASGFSYEKDTQDTSLMEGRIESIEELIAKLKELLNSKEEDFED